MRTILLKNIELSKNKMSLEGERYLNALSAVLVGLGLWIVIDGFLSQSFPEQLIRVIRATVGVMIIIIGIVQN